MRHAYLISLASILIILEILYIQVLYLGVSNETTLKDSEIVNPTGANVANTSKPPDVATIQIELTGSKLEVTTGPDDNDKSILEQLSPILSIVGTIGGTLAGAFFTYYITRLKEAHSIHYGFFWNKGRSLGPFKVESRNSNS